MPTNIEQLDALLDKADGTDTDTYLPEFDAWARGMSAAQDASGASYQIADTMDDLRALSAAESAARPTCLLRGYNVAGDGKAAIYRWDDGSTDVDDGSNTIALDAGGVGRWKRLGQAMHILRAGRLSDDGSGGYVQDGGGLYVGGDQGVWLRQEGYIADGEEGSLAMYPLVPNRPGLFQVCPSGAKADMPGEDTASIAVQLSNGTSEERCVFVAKKGGEYRLASYKNGTGSHYDITFSNADVRLLKVRTDKSIAITNETFGGASGGNTVLSVENPGLGDRLNVFARASGELGIEFDGATNLDYRFNDKGLSIGGIPAAARLHTTHAETSLPNAIFLATSTAFATDMVRLTSSTAAASTYSFLLCRSAGGDIEYNFRGDGNAFCDGAWTGGGADYAEMFEWTDGNPDGEDRVGYSVVTAGPKIRVAQPGEEPIGVVSSTPVVLGDAGWNFWQGKYLRDGFGRFITEGVEAVEWEVTTPAVTELRPFLVEGRPEGEESKRLYIEMREVEVVPARVERRSYHADAIPAGIVAPASAARITVSRRVINPAYDPSRPYEDRDSRPEWSPIGLKGKLRMRKGQPVGSRWVKLRDISADVEEWLVL